MGESIKRRTVEILLWVLHMRFHDCDEFHTSLLDFLWGRDQISNPFL
jgi:hypothetical protein